MRRDNMVRLGHLVAIAQDIAIVIVIAIARSATNSIEIMTTSVESF